MIISAAWANEGLSAVYLTYDDGRTNIVVTDAEYPAWDEFLDWMNAGNVPTPYVVPPPPEPPPPEPPPPEPPPYEPVFVILAARWANVEQTAAIVSIEGEGSGLISTSNQRKWDKLLAWIASGNSVLPFVAPPLFSESEEAARWLAQNPAFRGLIKVLANRFGVTVSALANAIKNEV